MRDLISTFWREWEPHLAFFGAFGALAWLRASGHGFDTPVEIIILVVAGGPQARDMAVNIINAWRGSGKS